MHVQVASASITGWRAFWRKLYTAMKGTVSMANTYRHEPLTPATLVTAATNILILEDQAASKSLDLTPDQSKAAIRMAFQLVKVARDHARRRMTQ
jgi:hypothetical protein